jgi:hypothetical protein
MGQNEQAELLQAPPAGTFWKKYSPHYEFPLSLSSSAFVHLIGFVILGGLLFALLGRSQSKELPVDIISVGGGGGNPAGAGEGLGDGAVPGNKEAPPVDEPHQKEVVNEQQKLMTPEAKKLELTLPNQARVVDDAQAAANVDKAIVDAANKAKQLLAGRIAGQGKGGPGRGGGEGTGRGTGTGDGSGPGQGKGRSIWDERADRQKLNITHFGPADYLDKLIGVGAFLAAVTPDGDFIVYRDLVNRPAKGKVEDILSLKDRVAWTLERDSPNAISPQVLAQVLGITQVPSKFLLLLPRELNDELLAKELKESAAHGRKEEEIAQTVFGLVRRGKRYEFVVNSQTAKSGR